MLDKVDRAAEPQAFRSPLSGYRGALEDLSPPGCAPVAPEYWDASRDVHSGLMAGETAVATYQMIGLEA